jgi:hypothetical protein
MAEEKESGIFKLTPLSMFYVIFSHSLTVVEFLYLFCFIFNVSSKSMHLRKLRYLDERIQIRCDCIPMHTEKSFI